MQAVNLLLERRGFSSLHFLEASHWIVLGHG